MEEKTINRKAINPNSKSSKMAFEEYCKQFYVNRDEGHPLDFLRIPLSVIKEKYDRGDINEL